MEKPRQWLLKSNMVAGFVRSQHGALHRQKASPSTALPSCLCLCRAWTSIVSVWTTPSSAGCTGSTGEDKAARSIVNAPKTQPWRPWSSQLRSETGQPGFLQRSWKSVLDAHHQMICPSSESQITKPSPFHDSKLPPTLHEERLESELPIMERTLMKENGCQQVCCFPCISSVKPNSSTKKARLLSPLNR